MFWIRYRWPRERNRERPRVCLLDREERKRERTGKQKARERDREWVRERVHERIGKESGTGSSIILIQTPLLGP